MQAASLKSGDIRSLQYMREIAIACVYVQLGLSFVYYFSSLLIPKSDSAAIICGILAIAASLTPVIYSYYKKNFQSVFSCITLFNLAPIWFLYLEAVIPGYDAFEHIKPAYRLEAFFWISLFMLFTNLFYIIFWKGVSRFSIKSFKFLHQFNFKSSWFVVLTIFSFVVPLIGFYFFYGSAENLWIFLTAGRGGGAQELQAETVGGMGAFMSPLTWILQLTPLFGSIAFILARSKTSFYPLLSLILGLLVIFIFFLGGSRGTMMFVAAPALFFLFYYNWQNGMKFWIPATLLLFFIIGVMELQVRFRGNLMEVISDPEKAAKANDMKSVTTFDPSESHRDNNTYLLCLLIKGYPDKYPYEGFFGLYATLANPIPRALWPNKPVMDGAKDLSDQPKWVLDGPLFMGTTSLTYSVVGDAYKSAGLLGIIFYGFIYGLFLLFFDGVAYYTSGRDAFAAGILGVGAFLAFWGFRSFFALVIFLYPIALLFVTLRIIQMLRKL